MADFLNAHLVVAELSTRIQTAWGFTDAQVFDYQPREAPDTDHAVIMVTGATKGSGGAQCRQFDVSYRIVGQFAFDVSKSFTQFKTEKVNAFLSQIYKAKHFLAGATDLGGRFDVIEIGYEEIGEEHARLLEVGFTFNLETPIVSIPV